MKKKLTIIFLVLLCLPMNIIFSQTNKEQNKNMMLKIGDTAPEFSLPDKDGVQQKLRDYRGKWLVLYFYPKDDTPGCTKEACSFRDNYTQFEKMNVNVIGVSVDPEASHIQFSNKYKLPFTLLADSKKEVVKLYGAWGIKEGGAQMPMTLRMTYLIDPQGKIEKIYHTVSPSEHPAEILKDLESLIENKNIPSMT